MKILDSSLSQNKIDNIMNRILFGTTDSKIIELQKLNIPYELAELIVKNNIIYNINNHIVTIENKEKLKLLINSDEKIRFLIDDLDKMWNIKFENNIF